MKRETICLIIACLISFILTAGIMNWRMEIVHAELSDTQQSLAKEVFRFHVIAESDSANDQRIKLKVRDAVLKYMKAHMTRAERSDAKATKAWTLTHKKELTDTADKILKKRESSIPGESGGDHLLFSGQTVWRYHFSRGKLRSTENCTWEGKWT